MIKLTSHRFFQAALLLLFVAACSPVGDLGRASQPQKSVFDTLPAPVDPENYALGQSDEETRMQNLMQRFFSPMQKQSWLSPVRQGARALAGEVPDRSDYFLWLRSRPFASSAGRYRALLNEVQLDVMTLPAVFDAICAVQNTDRRRLLAMQNIADVSPVTRQAISERAGQNRKTITGFVSRVEFRYYSYSYALENLLLETPDEIARQVDDQLGLLAARMQVAIAGRFCNP